jgi:hypothetical protein
MDVGHGSCPTVVLLDHNQVRIPGVVDRVVPGGKMNSSGDEREGDVDPD